MQHHICPACKMPILPGQPSYGKGGEAFHSTCGDPLGIKAAVAAERERCAKIAETMPERVLVMYERPGSPPGNTYVHITGQKLIADAIRKSI